MDNIQQALNDYQNRMNQLNQQALDQARQQMSQQMSQQAYQNMQLGGYRYGISGSTAPDTRIMMQAINEPVRAVSHDQYAYLKKIGQIIDFDRYEMLVRMQGGFNPTVKEVGINMLETCRIAIA